MSIAFLGSGGNSGGGSSSSSSGIGISSGFGSSLGSFNFGFGPGAVEEVAHPVSLKVHHHEVLNADRMLPFVERCLKESPEVFLTMVIIALLAAIATGVISFSHSRKLASAPLSLQRKFYIRMMWFAPSVGLTSFTSLLCPRTLGLNELVRTQVEALTIWVFGTIVFLLMAKESSEWCSGDNFDEDNSVGTKMISALALQGPKKHFGVPPLGCCFRPCMRPHDLTRRQLQFARNCFTQYAYVYAVLGYLNAFMGLALGDHGMDRFREVTENMVKISGLIAIWGLMVIWRSTSTLLSKWNTGIKFWSIKGVVMINVLQLLLLDLIAGSWEDMRLPCFSQFSVEIWGNFLLCLEAVGLALLVRKAFPVEELQEWHDELHVHAAHVEMEGMFQSRSRTLTGTPRNAGALDLSPTDAPLASASAQTVGSAAAEAPRLEAMQQQESAMAMESSDIPISFNITGTFDSPSESSGGR